MKRTELTNFTVNNVGFNGIEKPIFCPHCLGHTDVNPVAYSAVTCGADTIFTVVFSPACCHVQFFAVYGKRNEQSGFRLLTIYPNTFPTSLNAIFKEVSPGFVNLYEQAAFAESNNLFDIAATGYRNALEILIKDFAVYRHMATLDEVCGCSLANAIERYLPDAKSRVAADVIRVIGNDFTHYRKRYPNVTFDVMKDYIEYFINAIEWELRLLNPPVPSRHADSATSPA